MATSIVPASSGPPTPRRPRVTAVDPVTAMQLAATKERQQRKDKIVLIGLAIFAIVSIAIGAVNWAMQGFEHAEKMACIELHKTQPQAECSSSTASTNTFKPAYVTPPVASSFSNEQAPAVQHRTTQPNDGIKTVMLSEGDTRWEMPSTGSPIRLCTKAINGQELEPDKGTILVGGKSLANGKTFIANGECVISKLKGGAS